MSPKKYQKVGRPTFVCRVVCTAALAAPYLYWWTFRYAGNAYFHLFLVLLALAASVALFVNSVFCLFRYRTRDQVLIGLLFIAVSVIGVVAMPYFLPGFKM